jgi:hypothetical protein
MDQFFHNGDFTLNFVQVCGDVQPAFTGATELPPPQQKGFGKDLGMGEGRKEVWIGMERQTVEDITVS